MLRPIQVNSVVEAVRGALIGVLAAAMALLPGAQTVSAQTAASPAPPAQAAAQVPGPNSTGVGGTQIQIPPPPPEATSSSVITSSSEVVRIDIEVTDKNGKTVKGLKPDQFTITDDGKAQKISSFSFQDIEAVETAAEPMIPCRW
jgi:hypothetical protein